MYWYFDQIPNCCCMLDRSIDRSIDRERERERHSIASLPAVMYGGLLFWSSSVIVPCGGVCASLGQHYFSLFIIKMFSMQIYLWTTMMMTKDDESTDRPTDRPTPTLSSLLAFRWDGDGSSSGGSGSSSITTISAKNIGFDLLFDHFDLLVVNNQWLRRMISRYTLILMLLKLLVVVVVKTRSRKVCAVRCGRCWLGVA